MSSWPGKWVADTSVFTHLARAGHLDLLEQLAPKGVLLVPAQVSSEIDAGREEYAGIPAASSLPWVQLAVLSDDEQWTVLEVKGKLGGTSRQHLGECEVIAVARHRSCVALIDERAARKQAGLLGVEVVDTLGVVVEAHKRLFDCDRERTIAVVDALIETGMWLPLSSGTEIITYAYEQGWLPE